MIDICAKIPVGRSAFPPRGRAKPPVPCYAGLGGVARRAVVTAACRAGTPH